MERINMFLDRKIMPYAGKLSGQRHFHAVFTGMIIAMPLIIIGSISLVLANLPIPNWSEWLSMHGSLDSLLSKITSGSFGIMALIVVFGIAHTLALNYKISGVSVGVLALSSFIIVTPSILDAEEASGIPYGRIGSGGLFTAIIIGLITTEIYRVFVKRDWTIKMPDTVPTGVSNAFSSILPGFTILFFWAIADRLLALTGLGGLHDAAATIIGIPLTNLGGGLGGTVISVALVSIIWFLGIHGADLVGAIMYTVWYAQMDANRLAFEAGQELPNIVSYPFLTNFVWLGGGGATLALAILLAFFSKSKQSKAIGKLSIVPSIFNVNEPLMFGLPIVLNPVMLFPYFMVPILNVILCYSVMAIGLVTPPVGINPSWTMPIGLSGAIATNWDFRAIILQFVVLAIDILIYYPFFKTMDRKQLEQETEGAT